MRLVAGQRMEMRQNLHVAVEAYLDLLVSETGALFYARVLILREQWVQLLKNLWYIGFLTVNKAYLHSDRVLLQILLVDLDLLILLLYIIFKSELGYDGSIV